MDENEADAQAFEVIGRGLARGLGRSRAETALADPRNGRFRFELKATRSLSPSGFRLVMGAVIVLNLIVGGIFYRIGAWPVLGFCGLDVALLYWAFRANFHALRQAETIDLSPVHLTLTRRHPAGQTERFEFNPYWVRVRLSEQVDGRNELKLASHGREFRFARFLSDDERRDFAECLADALSTARSTRVSPAA